MSKINSQVRHFIKAYVLTEMGEKVGPSKSYQWKEGIMVEIQDAISEKITDVETQEQLNSLIDTVIEEFENKKLRPSIEMIRNTLKQIPFDLIRKVVRKSSQ